MKIWSKFDLKSLKKYQNYILVLQKTRESGIFHDSSHFFHKQTLKCIFGNIYKNKTSRNLKYIDGNVHCQNYLPVKFYFNRSFSSKQKGVLAIFIFALACIPCLKKHSQKWYKKKPGLDFYHLYITECRVKMYVLFNVINTILRAFFYQHYLCFCLRLPLFNNKFLD